MRIEKKKQIAETLHEKFLKSQIVILTDYKGLNVTYMNDLRRKLRSAGQEPGQEGKIPYVEYQVVKNTLLVRAARDTEIALLTDHFEGPSAIAIGYKEPGAPANALISFAKTNEKLKIRGGVLISSDGKGTLLDLGAIRMLAELPPREILLARVLFAMNGVPTSLVNLLSQIVRQLFYVLMAIKEQKSPEPAA